tara:strand:+ start:5350 stop:5967 length:618 start_codon:yes stop_codon:yes gene_type:complete
MSKRERKLNLIRRESEDGVIVVITIAPPGVGKSTFAKKLQSRFSNSDCNIFDQDEYRVTFGFKPNVPIERKKDQYIWKRKHQHIVNILKKKKKGVVILTDCHCDLNRLIQLLKQIQYISTLNHKIKMVKCVFGGIDFGNINLNLSKDNLLNTIFFNVQKRKETEGHPFSSDREGIRKRISGFYHILDNRRQLSKLNTTVKNIIQM